MAEINLLSQNQTKKSRDFTRTSSFIVKALIFLVIVMAGYWGYLFYQVKATQRKIFDTQNDIKDRSERLVGSATRKEVVQKQGQLKFYNDLLVGQPHWSRLLGNDLAAITLKTATYVSISGPGNGTLKLTVSVPSYVDFDKFINAFNLKAVNKVFTDAKVTAVTTSQQNDKLDIRFEATLKYTPDALKSLNINF